MLRFQLTLVALLAFWLPDAPRASGAPVRESALAPDTVIGVVFDSITNSPIAEAFVVADPGGLLTATNADGQFVIVSKQKVHKLSVYHVATERLGLTGLVATRPDLNQPWFDARLATPSMTTLWSKLCTGQWPSNGSGGIVIGNVRHSNDSTRVSNAVVSLDWDIGPSGERHRHETTISDSTGQYVFCGVQETGDASLVAKGDGERSGAVKSFASRGGFRRVDLMIAVNGLTAPVAGRVLDDTGAPVANALVTIDGHSDAMRSNAQGAFAAARVPAGSRMLNVSKPGHAVESRIIDIPAKGLPSLEVVLGRGFRGR